MTASQDDGTSGVPRGDKAASAQTALDEVQRSVSAGAAKAALEILFGSGFLDGLVWRIKKTWGVLSVEDAEDLVAEAVETLYTTMRQGKRIHSVGGWLWKVADRKATDLSRHRSRERTLLKESRPGVEPPPNIEETPEEEVLEPEEQRTVALRVARRLVPLLGQSTIQRVMAYLFDAIEEGVEDLSPNEIGEALGLDRNTVSKSLERGFRRLKERARAEGEALLEEELRRVEAERS